MIHSNIYTSVLPVPLSVNMQANKMHRSEDDRSHRKDDSDINHMLLDTPNAD